MEKILITGASGNYGYAVIEALLKRGIHKNLIFAMVRDKAKAKFLTPLGVNIVIGDYNDYNSLITSFSGCDKLLLVSSGDLKLRSEQHKRVVKAAKNAGINHIVYTSQLHKSDNRTSPIHFIVKSHLITEAAIMKSGMNYTILRNGLYMDMLPIFLGEKILENGIFLPAGQGKIAFTLRSEMAEVTANILISEGHSDKIYDITSDAISFTEIAAQISEIKNKNITYLSPNLETFINTVTKAGIHKEYAKMVGGFAAAAEQGELESKNSMMENLLERKPTTSFEFIKKLCLV